MKDIKKIAELFEMLSGNFSQVALGKKVSQKMFYFFERKGIVLGLRFGIHFYGPYSSVLDDSMHILESEDYIKIDTSETTHKISLGCQEIERNILSNEEIKYAKFILENFADKTPRDLEALSTMDYIANSIYEGNFTKNELIKKFKEIKGQKFSDKEIGIALDLLIELGFISNDS